jgi:drug/metabolite transporter (DMT)-like permease
MSAPQGYALGIAYAVIAGLCFSTAGLLMRRLELDAWEIVFWRCVFAAPTLGVYLVVRHRERVWAVVRGMGWPGLTGGIAMAYTLTAYCLALDVTLVANAVACLGITPFLTALIGWVAMRERVAPITWFGMVAALAGILMIVSGSLGAGALLGNMLALSLAAVYAVFLVLMRRARGFDMMPAALLATLIGGVVALPLGLPFEIAWGDLPYLVGFGAGQLGAGLLFLTLATRHVPVAPLSLIMLIEPVGGVLWAWLGAGEVPVGLTLAGAGLVLLAVFGHALYGMWPRPSRVVAG